MRRPLGGRYEPACRAIDALVAGTVRASSLVENLNGRLRTYFSLRRHLGPDYLELLRFYLNHRVLERSERPERAGQDAGGAADRRRRTGTGWSCWASRASPAPRDPWPRRGPLAPPGSPGHGHGPRRDRAMAELLPWKGGF